MVMKRNLQKERRRMMGKTIKDISAPPDHPMFTGATIVSGIIRPVLSKKERKVKPKKKVKGDKK